MHIFIENWGFLVEDFLIRECMKSRVIIYWLFLVNYSVRKTQQDENEKQ